MGSYQPPVEKNEECFGDVLQVASDCTPLAWLTGLWPSLLCQYVPKDMGDDAINPHTRRVLNERNGEDVESVLHSVFLN